MILNIASDEVKKKIPIVSLVSDCSTSNVIQLTKMAIENGATEIMVTPPYYSHVQQRELKIFFTKIADASNVPLWLYHQPGETKLSIDIDTVVELSKHSNIVGIKAASGEVQSADVSVIKGFSGVHREFC